MRSLLSNLALSSACVLLLASTPRADLRLPSILSDGLVLQQNSEVTLWGWAEPGSTITVEASWEGVEHAASCDDEGRFAVVLSTISAQLSAGPHRIRFAGDGERVIEDVLLGEVWIASGQSNMEWTIQRISPAIENYEAELAAMWQPRLRTFDVKNEVAFVPADDCQGTWVACTPQTWPVFSAVGYYFGRELLRELDVPIGIVATNWGGTRAEAWTSAMGLEPFPEFQDVVQRAQVAAAAGETVAGQASRSEREFWERIASVDTGSQEGRFADASFDDAQWSAASIPGAWDEPDGGFDGVAWYRTRFTIPEAWVGRNLVLELGPIDDMDTTFLDGVRIGGLERSGSWQTPRVYPVGAELATAGEHVLAVRVLDTGGVGGLTGRAEQVRLRLEEDAEGREALPLAGEWRHTFGASLGELGGAPGRPWFHANSPTALFNKMIAPIADYDVRGVIWYQGESNRMQAERYRTLFPAMIADWRRVFGQPEMPFLFVQIAPFAYGQDTGQAARLREAQTMTLSVPHTGMAVTMDIGNPVDIHPKNKWDVGQRLALHALAMSYGRDELVTSGPLLEGMSVEGSRIRLHLRHAAGLAARGGGELTHFTIAGVDRVFRPARATIDGESLLVESEQVREPIAVRYAWGAADEPNLMNGAGLPAPSFRTDDW